MSKGIASYPKDKRPAVVARRLRNKTNGLGYFAAQDYMNKVSTSLSLASNYTAVTDLQPLDVPSQDKGHDKAQS